MRILYIATSFPTPDKGSTIYTDLAEALYNSGHEITVAVAEQSKNIRRTIMNIERGFKVLRIVTGNYYDVGLLEKGFTTLRIPSIMKKGITKYLINNKFDFILYEAPPVTNANLVIWAKKKFGCTSYLMLKDIFPQNAVDLGIFKKNGLLHKFFLRKEKRLYDSTNIIGCMSDANRKYILEHNKSIKAEKLEIFPNTKKISKLYSKEKLIIREKYSIPKEACVFLFGGNMGKPQYIDLLCKAINYFRTDNKVFFLFVGRGTERHKIEKTIISKEIKNAILIENLHRDEFEQIIKECDIGLIILDPRFTIPNYPSRILTYMEYAKPVLAATDKATDLKNLVEESKCGEWVWSGDENAFIEKIKEMSKNKFLVKMGENGRKYIEKNFNLSISVKLLEKYYNDEKMMKRGK